METNHITLKQNFIYVYGTNGQAYYGGNQNWYDNKLYISHGCGAVAASNTMAYLSKTSKKYRKLCNKDLTGIRQSDFTDYMTDIASYIPPIDISKKARTLNSLASKIGINGLNLPNSIGVPSISILRKGVLNYAKDNNAPLICKEFHRGFPAKREELALNFIKKGLTQDKPIILLIYKNKTLLDINYPSSDRTYSFQYHWVTITGLYLEDDINDSTIEVSSWGKRFTLYFTDVYNSLGFGGMIYFK